MAPHLHERAYLAQQPVEQRGVLQHHLQHRVQAELLLGHGGVEQPRIAEDGAPQHYAVGAGVRGQGAGVGGVSRVAVADDRNAATAGLADGARYRVPVGGGVGQFAHGARVQGDGGGAQLQQDAEPLLEDVVLDAEPGLDRHRQPAGAVAGGGVDLAHAAGVADQRGAGALLQHPPVRAAGVDVDAVEAEVARKLGALVEGLRARAEELHHQRALAGMEGELRQQPLAPARAQPFAGGELGHHQVGPPATRDNLPERRVGDVGHRRQQQHRARQRVPETGPGRLGVDLHGPRNLRSLTPSGPHGRGGRQPDGRGRPPRYA